MNIFFKKRTIASLGVLLLCSHNAISETKTKVYNIEASAPVIIKSLSYNFKTYNNFSYQHSKSKTTIVGHTFQFLFGSETDPKLACFDNEAFSLKLSFNLQFISATKVKVYIRPIMKKNKITAYIGGDAYSSTFESGYRNMLEECKMRDEIVTYTYNNGIVKFKSSVLGNRSLKISNNGKSLIEDKFAFNKIK